MFLNFLVASVGAGIPLLFGTMGEILTEKVGHLNLGVEGMMSIGACTGFMVGYFTDNFIIAMLAAFLGGMLAALIYAALTVTLKANQNVTGLTLTIFGVGLANFVGVYFLNNSAGGTLKLPATITAHMRAGVPVLSEIPVLGMFFDNPFIYIGLILAVVLTIYLRRTKVGLKVQAIGENPAAADAAGIHVTRLKYINILLGGGICGIGGAYCSMIINGGVWINNNVGGLGWIAVALVIFANWNPSIAIVGSFVFGAMRVLKYYIPTGAIPIAFFDMLPFLMTAVVLVLGSMRKKRRQHIPQSLGINYFREER